MGPTQTRNEKRATELQVAEYQYEYESSFYANSDFDFRYASLNTYKARLSNYNSIVAYYPCTYYLGAGLEGRNAFSETFLPSLLRRLRATCEGSKYTSFCTIITRAQYLHKLDPHQTAPHVSKGAV